MCDEADPDIDYNAESYVSRDITDYALEVNNFLQGASYLLSKITDSMLDEEINTIVFDAARTSNLDLKLFFKRVYQTLFKQNSGPKLASFISLLGVDAFKTLLEKRLVSPLNY